MGTCVWRNMTCVSVSVSILCKTQNSKDFQYSGFTPSMGNLFSSVHLKRQKYFNITGQYLQCTFILDFYVNRQVGRLYIGTCYFHVNRLLDRTCENLEF